MVQPLDVFTESNAVAMKGDPTNDANTADLQPLDPHAPQGPIGETVIPTQGHPQDQDPTAPGALPQESPHGQPPLAAAAAAAAAGDSAMTRRLLLEEEQRRVMMSGPNQRPGTAPTIMQSPAQFARIAMQPQQLIGNPRFMMAAPMAIHPQNANFFLAPGAPGQAVVPAAQGTGLLHPAAGQQAAFAAGPQPAFMAAHPQMMAMGMNPMMAVGAQMDPGAMAAYAGIRPIDIQNGIDPDKVDDVDRNRSPSPEMPVRPLSAYNFFFSDERERILKEDQTGVKGDEDNEDIEAKKQRLLDQHLSKDRSKRRPHRKTHGKIGFTSLSKEIGKRWRSLPEAKRVFYREIAAMDMDRYQRSVAEYNNERLSKRTRR